MDSLGRMIAIIIAVIFLFMFPIRYEAQKDAIVVDSYVRTELSYFFTQINARLEVTQEMYEEFNNQLLNTGVSYEIEIERYVTTHAENLSNYLEYEDVMYELKEKTSFPLKKGEYLLIRVTPKTMSIIDRLKNLFLPTLIQQGSYVKGGKMI